MKSYYLGYVTYLTVRDNNIDKQAHTSSQHQLYTTAQLLTTFTRSDFQSGKYPLMTLVRVFFFFSMSSAILSASRPFVSATIYDARPFRPSALITAVNRIVRLARQSVLDPPWTSWKICHVNWRTSGRTARP